jgi:hypothetical protein
MEPRRYPIASAISQYAPFASMELPVYVVVNISA